MDVGPLLLDLYDRIPPLVEGTLDGLDVNNLVRQPSPGANTIAWLIWHLARVQDHHLAALVGEQQLWVTGDWGPRFGLASDPDNTGYGHTAEEVAAVRPAGPQVLRDYFTAVYGRSRPMLEALGAADLERIVDRRWDPPVTLGVRLVSVADDSLQHLGQAAYVRGLLER